MDEPSLTSLEVVKKKRGRKPKVLETNPSKPDVDTSSNTDISLNIETIDPNKKAKRGRRPKYVYSTQDVVTAQNISLSDDENIIVKLNINDDMFQKGDDPRCDDEHPYAYNRDEYCNLSNFADSVDKNATETVTTSDLEAPELRRKVISLLKDFEEKNKINEWPSNTSISCYWCCHKFDNAPYGIPVNFNKSSFDVFGCFCSLECAAAYNFKLQENIDEMWERYNLINLLHRHLNLEGKIVKPAPDRLALKMFGGYLDIHEFRQFFKSNKLVNVNFPPMLSLTQQIEEVNDYELNNDYKYIPIDTDRIDKYKAKMMFKRNKPLVNTKNSIDSIMNLKFA